MATEKRKAGATERPAKKIKFDDNGKAHTVPNETKTAKAGKDKAESAEEHPAQRRSVKSSLLNAEDRSFPRGGASVLTPLEQRQIRADAERDVLFEEAGKAKSSRTEYGEDEDGIDDKSSTKPAAKKRRKSKTAKIGEQTEKEEQIKIRGLSYKVLTIGTLVLGQVTAITSKDVALALPNNLTGFVPITAISDIVNDKINALIGQDDEEEPSGDKSDDEKDDVDIQKLFRIGQYLRASVTATSGEARGAQTKAKRRIELSVNPVLSNSGLQADEISVNQMVQATVRSVEDHGLVMDLGLENDTVRGFVSKKELGQNWDIEKVQEGQVMLCCVTGTASDNKVIKLCPDPLRIGDISKHILKDAKTVDPFMPGAAVEVLITASSGGGLTGKILGSIDATADVVHSSASVDRNAFDKLKPAQKVNARVIFTYTEGEAKKVGVSLLDHVRKFEEQTKIGKKKQRLLESSSIVNDAKVTQVLPGIGLFLDLRNGGHPAFAHISKLADQKVEALFEETGTFALGTTHQARVLSFNPIDGLYSLSLEKSVLNRKYLRLEDVKVGSVVEGKVEKLILGAKGVTGILVTLEDGITGLVPETHLSDVTLQHPERKFREGFPVRARVLSLNLERRQMRLTLKKTLVNTDLPVWKTYASISVGQESIGTVIKVQQNGAVLQFYESIRAWLPVAEMSETYIKDATQHFRVGQAVTVRAKQVDIEDSSMIVSCRSGGDLTDEQSSAWNDIKSGQIVDVKITEVLNDKIAVEAGKDSIKGFVNLAHLSDSSEEKSKKLLKQLRTGQKLTNMLVVNKNETQHFLILSSKASLIEAAKSNTFITSFESVKPKMPAAGFVRNITPDGIYVEFGNGVVGYLPKPLVSRENAAKPAFGMRKDASITTTVLSVDEGQKRFVLTMKAEQPAKVESIPGADSIMDPIGDDLTSMSDIQIGKVVHVKIASVKDTQLNVRLAENVQGRIDVSEAFTSWVDIKYHKKPLSQFTTGQILQAKVLGVHDARNHRFLPISHRQGKVPVFELTARIDQDVKSEADLLTIAKIEVGSEHIAYINNIASDHVWANITPNVRGRIEALKLTNDAGQLQNISKHFPIGSAIKVKVVRKNEEKGRLDLESVDAATDAPQTLNDLSVGSIVAGKVVRVTERSVLVALSETVSGLISLTDITDDFSDASTAKFKSNDVISVSVVEIDSANKRLFLSTRPSLLLSSGLPVKDAQITSIAHLKVADVLRGFVKVVRSNGIIVALGPRVEAFVRISDLSDAYIKDWQAEFSIDKLVEGKIVAVDANLNHVQLSLKASHVDKNYIVPKKLDDFAPGDIVTGKIRKVEDFGVFIDVDDTQPRVSGLCHRSQVADKKVGDVSKLFDEGDRVKAKILSIDLEKRRISFGLKASYFADQEDESESSADEDAGAIIAAQTDDEMDVDGGIELDLSAVQDMQSEDESASEDDSMDVDEPLAPLKSVGTKSSGFDWIGTSLTSNDATGKTGSSKSAPSKKTTPTSSAAQTIDRTGDLDTFGPQSTSDFERLLLSSPHDSSLWVQYMAFHLRLSELSTAREIGQRALQTIPLRETDEKANIWIALLNLETSQLTPSDDFGPNSSTSGSDERGSSSDALLAQTFRDALAVQDPYAMHLALASILAASGLPHRADRLYASMLHSNPSTAPSAFSSSSGAASTVNAKASRAFRAAPELWLTYARFLFDNEALHDPARARALLPRALQSVPEREKRDLTIKFAAMEFVAEGGDAERGRTILEGVVDEWPRYNAAWDAWVDAEMGLLGRTKTEGEDGQEGTAEQKERVRRVYERMAKGKMKSRRARFVFKRWREFEEKEGSDRDVERVVGLAKEWVAKAKSEQGEDAMDEK